MSGDFQRSPGYREAAPRLAFAWTCPFARRATVVGGMLGLFMCALAAFVGVRSKSLECFRSADATTTCTATETSLFGSKVARRSFPDSVALDWTCILRSCGLSGRTATDARVSFDIPANGEHDAVRVRDDLDRWRTANDAAPFVRQGSLDYADAGGIVPGSMLVLLAVVFGPWRSTVRLAGAPRTLTVLRRRFPLRRRQAEFAAGGDDRVVFEPAPNGAWGWVILVRTDGTRQRLFGCQAEPHVHVGVAALNGALAGDYTEGKA